MDGFQDDESQEHIFAAIFLAHWLNKPYTHLSGLKPITELDLHPHGMLSTMSTGYGLNALQELATLFYTLRGVPQSMTPTISAPSIAKVASQNSSKIYIRAGDIYGFYFACFKDLLSFRPVLSESRLIPCKRIAMDDVTAHWSYHFHQYNCSFGETSIWEYISNKRESFV
jgi:hypothetical protein